MTRALAVLAALDLLPVVLAFGSPHVAVALHVVLTLAAAALWLRGAAPGVAAAVAVPMGPVALLLAQHLARAPRGADLLPEMPERPGQAAKGEIGRLLDGRVRHVASDALGSLAVVLRHGDIAARRSALEAVVRSFEPALSPLVALALSDRDQTIRALAAAAAARITQNLALTRERLEAGGEATRRALADFLGEHARDNVLLSDTQRMQLRTDMVALLAPGEAVELRAEAAWAAGDYAQLDALVADAPEGRLASLRGWWRAEPA